MKLLELRKINGDRPLKAFCDVEIIPGVICKEFRILEFPRRLRLGGAAVGWLESEIMDWLQKKADARRSTSERSGEAAK